MNIEKFREVIAHRIYVEDISMGEWYTEIEKCQNDVIKIITEDIDSSIDFLNNECTADEYSWISEVLDEIVGITHSREFLETYKSLKDKFLEEFDKYNIDGMIASAEGGLKWEEEHGEGSKKSGG